MTVRIGDTARAACQLYPSGRVLIGNVPYPARAVGKSIEAASEVTVIGGDRFCLLVQPVNATQPVASLPRFGAEVLVGKQLAAAESAEAATAVKRVREEHARDLRRFTVKGLVTGLVLGILLIAMQTWRVGFTPDLLLVPPLASIGFAALAGWFLWFGSETNEALLLVAVIAAAAGLFGGTYLAGPLVGLTLCLASGFSVSLVGIALVALKSPIE